VRRSYRFKAAGNVIGALPNEQAHSRIGRRNSEARRPARVSDNPSAAICS